MADDICAVLRDAEAAALRALERVETEPDRVLALRDAIVLVLDVTGQLHEDAALREAVGVLQRIVPRSVAVLHEARQLIQMNKSKASPILKALLMTLSSLADRSGGVAMEVFEVLVQLVHTVCATSMTSADVVQLFEFLRISRAPARRLVLQMQTALLDGETMPRAVFTMRGLHAGIIAPSTEIVFSKKGYSVSFGLLLEASASVVSLYSFRGSNGQGVSAMIEGTNLLLKMHGPSGATSQVIVPFADWRTKMETSWLHVCIVHAKKMVFKDKIAVFADGLAVFNGNLPYPDPLCMVGGQNCIGVIPAVSAGFQGRMWSPTLFGQPLNEAEVQRLHWLTHWKNDLGSVTAENTGLTDKSKFIFSYDARSCDFERRICYDISGNECHGWMEPGTKAVVTQGICQVMDAIGGSACFLLLLLDQIPEMAEFHPKQELTQDEISDLIAFVCLGLRTSVACRAHFLRLQGVNVLAFIIQSVSPQYLSVRVLDSVVGILESVLQTSVSVEVASDHIQLLLFRNTNWFLAPFETQAKLIREVLPVYLKILVDICTSQAAGGQKTPAMAAAVSAMEVFGIVSTTTGAVPSGVTHSGARFIDVTFFCNLLVQVYAPRRGFRGEQDATSSHLKTAEQLASLRQLILSELIDRLLFPAAATDDLTQWRQLFAHIHDRCEKLEFEPYVQDGDGVEVKEILSYLTRILSNESPSQHRLVMTTKVCKLSQGTQRLWWRAMRTPVPDIRLEGLKLFEAYCSDKVVLKRRDIVVLVAAHQAYPIDLATADVLLNLVVGRKHIPYYGNASIGSAMTTARSINVARLEFVPIVLLGLSASAGFDVQLHVMYEVKTLIATASAGQTAVEAVRSWPPWLGQLLAIIRHASTEALLLRDNIASETETGLSPQGLNDLCAVLTDDQAPVSAKLDAVNAIGFARDLRGCDFVLTLVQSTDLPSSLVKAIVCTVQDRFPSRCPHLVRRIGQLLVVDVMVYSVLHVRNGWLHFLELYFCTYRNPSELCSFVAPIIDRIVRRISPSRGAAGTIANPVHPEHAEFMWENLSQVAAILSLVKALSGITSSGDGSVLSRDEQRIVYRKAFDLWYFVIPRLHLINWDEMKSQLLQNANFSEEIPMEDKEIFCYVVAMGGHARFLALDMLIRHVNAAYENNEVDGALVAQARRMLELLRVIPSPLQKAPMSSSKSRASFSSSAGVTDAFATYTADSAAFFGEARSREAQLPRELPQLYSLDFLYNVLGNELQRTQDFETAHELAELVILLASAALRLQPTEEDEVPSSASEVSKSLQIIASTDLSFFTDISKLKQIMSLWGPHHDSHATFCSTPVLDAETQILNEAFSRRWIRVLTTHSHEFNPFLIEKDASSQASILAREESACDATWREIKDEIATSDAARFDALDDKDKGLPATLKQDAEKFASSVHKLITQSSRETRSSTAEEAVPNELASSQPSSEPSSDVTDALLWKVNSRENSYRMRLRLKSVRENYRNRNVSCEYGDNSLHEDVHTRLSTHRIGPRRFQSARDNISGAISGNEIEKSWRSETGSDYSDFLADAQMRAAIIRSCPSVGSDRDSFSHDLSEDEDEDDLQLDTSQELLGESSAAFDKEVADLVMSEEPNVCQRESNPIPVPVQPDATPAATFRSASPSSPFGTLSTFGASILSVVGGVTDVVAKAAKEAKDAVEFGVDSLYTARDTLTEDAHSLAQGVTTVLSDAKTRHDPSPGSTPDRSVTESGARRLTVSTSPGKETPSETSTTLTSKERPELFPLMPTSGSKEKKHKSPGSTGSSASKNEVEFDANLVRHMNIVAGKLVLTESHLWFVAERVIDEHETVLAERKKGTPTESIWRFLFKRRCWKVDDIVSINRRRYLLKPCAVEIFIHSSRKNYFFSMAMDDILRFHEALMSRRPLLLRRDPTMRRLRHPSSIFRNSNMSVRWMHHEISTFEYLMWLNTIAGRTYNDLTQYPVFPWVIADYESSILDLSRPSTFRDLSKPIGALDPTRLKFFLDRYHAFEDSDIPKFMYGTHYSNIGVVLYYLIRLEPFTSYALNVQGGKFDHADRLFHSIAETWNNCLHDFNDVKELTPEWFYLPEFLKNCNRLDLGSKQNGAPLGDVVLPPWACSPEDFVLKNLMALESEYVSTNIHQWIDLIFGASQRGPAAVDANNVYFYLTYEGMVDVDSITDPVTKSSMRAQIAHFGQTPTQVLRDPHPPRLTIPGRGGTRRGSFIGESTTSRVSLVSSPKGLGSLSEGNFTLLLTPHDHPITLLHLVPGTSTMICIDTNGQVSFQRYGTKCVKVHHTPFTNDLSSTATKASVVFKPPPASTTPPHPPGSPGAVSFQTNGSAETPAEIFAAASSDYIELHDRKTRKIVGEKRLVALNQAYQMVSFLNSGNVYCSVGHHDFSARFHSCNDGALLYRLLQHQAVVKCVGASSNGSLLALGSSDGTISVWKVAHIASTLLDSIKIFRASKNARPVHSNDYAADQVLLGHGSPVNCVAVSDDLNVCVSGSVSNECLVHDLADGSILRHFEIPGTNPPGIVSIALSSVGCVIVQSLGLDLPMLYAFHLNGTLLAKTTLDTGVPMASISISTRFSKVIASNSDVAIAYSMLSLGDKEVLLEKHRYGEISCQALSPDETHVIFGVGSGKLVSLSLLAPSSQSTLPLAD